MEGRHLLTWALNDAYKGKPDAHILVTLSGGYAKIVQETIAHDGQLVSDRISVPVREHVAREVIDQFRRDLRYSDNPPEIVVPEPPERAPQRSPRILLYATAAVLAALAAGYVMKTVYNGIEAQLDQDRHIANEARGNLETIANGR